MLSARENRPPPKKRHVTVQLENTNAVGAKKDTVELVRKIDTDARAEH